MTQWLADDPMAHRLDVPMPRGLPATTQGLDDSMACGRSDGATIRADVLDTIRPEVSASARRLDDAMDECYNDEMSEKATMQIGR